MKCAFYKATLPGVQGLYSRLVRFIDRGAYSHCELVFSDGMSASSSFLDRGVRFKQIDFDPAKWDIVEVTGDEKSARQWFNAHAGQPYDLIGTARFIFGVIPPSQKKWFCSEAVAAALGMNEPWRYGPCGLFAALSVPSLIDRQ